MAEVSGATNEGIAALTESLANHGTPDAILLPVVLARGYCPGAGAGQALELAYTPDRHRESSGAAPSEGSRDFRPYSRQRHVDTLGGNNEKGSIMTRNLRSRQLVAGIASLALIGGMTSVSLALSSGTAGAVACGIPSIASCSATATLSITAGNLTFVTPASLAWSSLLNGAAQSVVDTRPADQVATINDASGTQAGWRISISATTFTNAAYTTNNTLPDTGTLSYNGSTSSATSANPPAIACVVVNTCVLPIPSVTPTFPLLVPTSPTGSVATISGDASVGTGVGNIQSGGSASGAPISWWLNVPGTALAGSYSSVMTATISTGP
jgi:hypothetical protein